MEVIETRTRIQPPAFGREIFEVTMKGLEAGLRVVAAVESRHFGTHDLPAICVSSFHNGQARPATGASLHLEGRRELGNWAVTGQPRS